MYCLVWQRFWPLKWRLAHLSPGSRWAPVLELYIEYCSARLDGIGGDSSQLPASLTWKPLLPGEDRDGLRGRELCGKVVEVLFDCHGDLEGFVLDDCCERRVVKSRERGVTELVLRARRENRTVCVTSPCWARQRCAETTHEVRVRRTLGERAQMPSCCWIAARSHHTCSRRILPSSNSNTCSRRKLTVPDLPS